MKNRKNRKGGFSIAEAIIALSIIVVVSIAAATITLSSISLRYTLTNRSIAINFADNAVECFKAAESVEEFKGLIEQVCEGDWSTLDDTKIFKNDKFTAEITVDFVSSRPEFEIVVNEIKKDGRTGDEIISLEYIKGAK